MTTADEVTVPPAAASVAGRYRRVAYAASIAFAVAVASVAVAVYVWTDSLVALVLVGLGLVLAARVPVFRTEGRVILAADASPGAVRAEFRGATPPLLAFQWGNAVEVRATDRGTVYELPNPLGSGTTRMSVDVRRVDPSEPNDLDDPGDLELVVTTDDSTWATYAVSVDERDGTTVAEIDVESDRRFGLRRLPQLPVAAHYRRTAMAAQGYTVVEHDSRVRV